MEEVLRVRSQRTGSNRSLRRPQERSKRRYPRAQYELSETLKPSYSISDEAPRHPSMDLGYAPVDTLSMQASPSLPTSNMFNLIDPSYVAVSACYHNNSPISSQPWRNFSQFETYGTAPYSRGTYNAESSNSPSSTHYYGHGSDMLHSGSGLDMEWKTALTGFCLNHGPNYPNMCEQLASSGLFQPSGDISSLYSVQMKRQPANIGYERLPDQGQDFNNNDGPETLALGHDTTLENCPWDSHVAPVTPADRRNSNMDNNWSMQRLPRPASKARTGRKGVDLSSSTLVTQHEYPKSAPTTPSGGKLDLIERRQSLGTPVPLAKVVGLGSGNTSTKTGPDPKQHVLSPGGQRPGPSGSISSPLVTLSNPFVVYDLASGREMPKKRTRNMSPEAKYHAACVRRLPGGACGSCKLSKRKCNHVLEEDKADSSLDPESADGRPKDEGSASSRWKTCL